MKKKDMVSPWLLLAIGGGAAAVVLHGKKAQGQTDTTPPTGTIKPMAAIQPASFPYALTITGTASDNVSVSKVDVAVIVFGSTTVNYQLASGTTNWQKAFSIGQAGSYVAKVRVTDSSGNTFDADMPFTVNDLIIPPPPPPVDTNDKWGIKKLYTTVTGGREYYINMAATTLTQLADNGMVGDLPSNTTRNADGSWRIQKTETPRWTIRSPGGLTPWRNVEITAQMKLVDAGSGNYLQMYARGEQHSTDPLYAWHGSAYKARLRFDGAVGFIGERYHDGGKVVTTFNDSGYTAAQGYTASGTGSILNKWITWKYVIYNINNNSQVKLEIWVDVAGTNTFKKIREYTDIGSWPSSSNFPAFMSGMKSLFSARPPIPYNRDTGAEMRQSEIMTWAGQYVSFRSDLSTYDLRNISVREIHAP